MFKRIVSFVSLLAYGASAQPIPQKPVNPALPIECSRGPGESTGRFDTRVFWRVTKASGAFPDLCKVLERGAAGVESRASLHGFSSVAAATQAGRTFLPSQVFEYPAPIRQAGDIWTSEVTPARPAADLTNCRFAFSKTFFVQSTPDQRSPISPASSADITYVGTPVGPTPMLEARVMFRARLGEVLAQCTLVPQ